MKVVIVWLLSNISKELCQSLLDMGLSLNFNLDIMNKVDRVELGHYPVGFMNQASHAV